MRLVLIAAFCCAGSAVQAQSPDALVEKLCIFSAAQKIPTVQGLQITGSRVSSRGRTELNGVPVEPRKLTGQIDVTAAGQDAVFEFTCIIQQNGSIATMLTGLVK